MAAVTTVAHYVLPEGDAGRTLEDALEPIARQTRDEDGCLGFAIVRDDENPSHLVLIERWASPEALEAHRRTAHFQNLVATIAPALRERRVLRGTDWRRFA